MYFLFFLLPSISKKNMTTSYPTQTVAAVPKIDPTPNEMNADPNGYFLMRVDKLLIIYSN